MATPRPSSILDLLSARISKAGETPAVFEEREGVWKPISLPQLLARSLRLAQAFHARGLQPGDRVAVACRTRVEWIVIELAAMHAGFVIVGIDAHGPAAQTAEILRHSGAAALVADSPRALERVPVDLAREMRLVVSIDSEPSSVAAPKFTTWGDLTATNGSADSGDHAKFVAHSGPATLLYTSGTTGQAKGIVYHQRQLIHACTSIMEEFPSVVDASGSMLCWLPMSALFQRMMNYVALASGIALYVVDDPRRIVEHARKVQPTYFIAVPRFFEKLHQGIEERLAKQPRWIARRVKAAIQTRASEDAGAHSAPAAGRLLDRLLLRKLRGLLGRRLRFVITGSAPMSPSLLTYFRALDILVLEAYGLSENAVPMAANRPDAYRFGSVGQPFAASAIRIAEDGEILVHGPGLFDGYVGQPAPDAFTQDGFFRTGDRGRFDADGYLFLEGRKTDPFKLSTGRWIVPLAIESVYKRIPYIEHIIVAGAARQYPVALLDINEALLAAALGDEKRVPGSDLRDNQAVHDQITSDLEAVSDDLAPYQRVRRFGLLPRSLSIEGGELTSSFKVRRNVVLQRYQALIDRLYSATA